ncbi:MAG: hypothetical protein H7317_16880 [Pseudorhodobacter sp.]|nr:hypothetical protein [Pseudorhodobacter sp.]
MRRFPAVFLTMLLLIPLPAQAQSLTNQIAQDGLAKTEARLAALPAPTPDDLFALGGVQFLHAIELSFQDRWRQGMTDRTGLMPLLRLPMDDNPHPAAFDPAAVVGIFIHAGDKLEQAKATLTRIDDTASVDVRIDFDDLWLDINANAARDSGEGVAEILGPQVLGGDDTAQHLPSVHFDTADAAWLAAYADLLTAICDLARAYDPTEPVTRITKTHNTMAALGPLTPDPFFGSSGYDPARLDGLDLAAVIIATLNQQPDKARMASARTHLLAMVAENRVFWQRVAVETDDNHEWLPNDHQRSALGVELPQGTGPAWLAVLADLEEVLNGDKLLPFWRAGPPAGLNMRTFFENPAPIDLAGWIQGWAVVPYLEKGNVVDSAASQAFDSLAMGQSMLFSLYLN